MPVLEQWRSNGVMRSGLETVLPGISRTRCRPTNALHEETSAVQESRSNSHGAPWASTRDGCHASMIDGFKSGVFNRAGPWSRCWGAQRLLGRVLLYNASSPNLTAVWLPELGEPQKCWTNRRNSLLLRELKNRENLSGAPLSQAQSESNRGLNHRAINHGATQAGGSTAERLKPGNQPPSGSSREIDHGLTERIKSRDQPRKTRKTRKKRDWKDGL